MIFRNEKVISVWFRFSFCIIAFSARKWCHNQKKLKDERETEITTKNNTHVGPYTLTRLYKGSYLFMDSLVMGAAKLHNNKVIVAPVLYNLKTEKITPQIEGKVEEFYDTYFRVGRHKFTYINGHYYEIVKDRKIKF